MGWHYKSPMSFPASYAAAIRSAKQMKPGDGYLLGGFIDETKAKQMAERFRYYKWCVRQNSAVHPEMFEIIESYDVRTSIIEDNFGGFLLVLTVKPTKISDFINLNPKLAEEILPLVD